jgi:hypothetical protein
MSARRWLLESSLSIVFLLLFLVTLVGQSVAGLRAFNEQQRSHDAAPIGWFDYVTSSDFGRAVMENWQSEFLQFTLFILATVWFVQKGSNESKRIENVGLESDRLQKVGGYAPENAPRWAKVRGWRQRLYENSLLLVMFSIFLLSWLAQSLTAWRGFNEEQGEHGEGTVSWATYVVKPDFWERTLQNWQSEFLAVGTMAVFTIYLRQRGSAESKPVGAPHDETGSSG